MTMKIRSLHKRDYEQLVELTEHPLVIEQTSQHPFLGSERVIALFERRASETVSLVAEDEGRIVGYITLFLSQKPREKHMAGLAIAVHPDIHGKGVGTRLMEEAVNLADNWLNLIRLELTVYTDNDVAVHLYKKLGFEIEGERKFAAYKRGQYADLYTMARIHPAFK